MKFVIRKSDGEFMTPNVYRGLRQWTTDLGKARVFNNRSSAANSIKQHATEVGLPMEVVPVTLTII